MPTLRSQVIKVAHTHPELRPHLLPLLKQATTIEGKVGDLVLTVDPRKGTCVLGGTGTVQEVTRGLNRFMLRRLLGVGGRVVQKPKGKVKGFDFHWSNAQAAWDVIMVQSASWDVDGATFVVWCPPDALSPLGKMWTRTEMQYVAKDLDPHPGYGSSMEGGQRR